MLTSHPSTTDNHRSLRDQRLLTSPERPMSVDIPQSADAKKSTSTTTREAFAILDHGAQ